MEDVKTVITPGEITLEEAERVLLVETLRANKGNKTDTARALGVAVKTVYNLIERHNVKITKIQSVSIV